ncbi:MAG: hypothetical protein WCD31_06455 [Gillisia sp.]
MNKALFLGILTILFYSTVKAQDTIPSQNPIEDQFTKLIETSNDYQGYKVVDYNDLLKLKKNTSAFIEDLNNKIVTQQQTINLQQQEIDSLKTDLKTTKQDLKKVNEEKDALTFLGMPFSKGSYKALMWSVVAILVIALLFFIYKYNNEHSQTLEARNKLSVTEKEFEAYRAKSLEKEQRLGRLLQDERNKANEK